MDCLRIKEELKELITGQVFVQEPMSGYTTWKIGGPADILVIPQNIADVQKIVKYAVSRGLAISTIGNGSNLLVLDKGIRGIVIIINNCIDEVKVEDNVIIAGGGVTLPKIARLAISRGLKGLEFAIGIPATIGGAVTMNAGAHGSNISEIIREVKVVDLKGDIETIPAGALDYQYRNSRIMENRYIVVEAALQLAYGEAKGLENIVSKNLAQRKAKQPLNLPNAGSVFKNPDGYSAGKLIDEAGCKGMQVGQSIVSEKHANFIVNLGGATATDILQLIEKVREQVKARFNIALELEIQIIGET